MMSAQRERKRRLMVIRLAGVGLGGIVSALAGAEEVRMLSCSSLMMI